MSGLLTVAVLVSGHGSNLQALLDAQSRGLIATDIRVVISNDPKAYGLIRARRFRIPTEIVPHQQFLEREQFDAAIMAILARYQPDLVVLAGFMRILTPAFIQAYRGRLLNIHPSLLPMLPGLRTHERALHAGLREHGASVHFVTETLDGGPVILQARVPVLPNDNVERLSRRVQTEEHRIYPAVVGWYAQGRLNLQREQIWLDGAPLSQPLRWAPL